MAESVGFASQNQTGGILSLVGVIGIIILVLLLAYFATKYMGKRMGLRGMQSGHMRVLDRMPIGSERELVIVRVAGKVLLLGVTAQRVTQLGELDGAEFPAEPPQTEMHPGFSDALKAAAEGWANKRKVEKDKQDE